MKLSKSSNIASSIVLTATLLSACGGGGGGGGGGTSTTETTPTPTPSGSSTPSPSGAPSPTPTPPGPPAPSPAPGATITLTPTSPLGVGVVAGRFEYINSFSNCVKDRVTGLGWNYTFAASTNYDSLVNRQTYIPPATTYGPESYGYATQTQIDDMSNAKGILNFNNSISSCGHSNWRLPTQAELMTLHNAEGTTCKWLDCNIFFQFRNDVFWTATNLPPASPAWAPHFAKIVDFSPGDGVRYSSSGRWLRNYLILVRN